MQKFRIIRKKYAKKARGSQKKASFTEKITKGNLQNYFGLSNIYGCKKYKITLP